MDIQVLNEVANLARQASLSKVSASVSAKAQLKGLKGNPVPAPGNPAPPALEGSLEQIQAPVTPDISSVARAASAYSAAVGDGLNSDELNAIQDLSGRVRTAVSGFLSQPGLAQAENAASVLASNPEAVQNLTANVEQAVVATLNLPAIEGGVIINATPPNADVLEEISAPENFISLERITNGAEPNNPVVAASPALENSPTSVETPVTVEEGVVTSNKDFTVTAASPALQNAQAGEHARVETPVSRPEVVTTNNQEAKVTAASPALQNAQAGEHARVETPVSRVAAASQQEPVIRPEVVTTNNQEAKVTAARQALQNAQAGGHARVQTPVSRSDVVASSQQESVRRPETVAVNPQETPVIAASPALIHSRASENTSVEIPVTVEGGVETSNRDFTVTAASPALQNAQAGDHARVETPVSRSDVVASSQQEPITRPEVVTTNNQEAQVTAASPALENANAQSRVVENPINTVNTPATSNRDFRVTAASPALQNGQTQNSEVVNPVNTPAPSANQGQGSRQPHTVNLEGSIASSEGAGSQVASGPSNPQPASFPQPGPAQFSDLFVQDSVAVNPENIRNVNELVNSVVDSEFTSEAKRIFSEPQVIRTVADLVDFILERLREIIAAQHQQS